MANSVERVFTGSGFKQKSGSRQYKSAAYRSQTVTTNNVNKQGKKRHSVPF